MTILNHPSDGLHPELIVLARAVAHEGRIHEDDLLKVCAVTGGNTNRIAGALSRWSRLGLFTKDVGNVELSKSCAPRRGQSIDEWTDTLPVACRTLALDAKNCLPLWGDDQGVSADFAKGVAWLLAQDIYQLPKTWDSIQHLEAAQIRGEKVIQNDTRLNGLRFWARYCGFATGESRSFFMDPTSTVRSVLPELKKQSTFFDAKTFLSELAKLLPVLDGGEYRRQIEERLDKVAWRVPPPKHLSMSLSFALRRLDAAKALTLESKADAEDAYWVAGASYRQISRFTHVRLSSAKR